LFLYAGFVASAWGALNTIVLLRKNVVLFKRFRELAELLGSFEQDVLSREVAAGNVVAEVEEAYAVWTTTSVADLHDPQFTPAVFTAFKDLSNRGHCRTHLLVLEESSLGQHYSLAPDSAGQQLANDSLRRHSELDSAYLAVWRVPAHIGPEIAVSRTRSIEFSSAFINRDTHTVNLMGGFSEDSTRIEHNTRVARKALRRAITPVWRDWNLTFECRQKNVARIELYLSNDQRALDRLDQAGNYSVKSDDELKREGIAHLPIDLPAGADLTTLDISPPQEALTFGFARLRLVKSAEQRSEKIASLLSDVFWRVRPQAPAAQA
jgi:hypothetical protein